MTVGNEHIFRVSKTVKGVKVTQYDGTGLADGIFTKPRQRYFYGEDAKEKARQYAENRAEEMDGDVRVVGLGERV